MSADRSAAVLARSLNRSRKHAGIVARLAC